MVQLSNSRNDKSTIEGIAAHRYRLGFVMEQQVGHATYYQNIRSVVEGQSDIAPVWIKVTYVQPSGFLEQLPFLSGHIKGSLRGAVQVRQGLRKAGRPLDGLFFFTQNPAIFYRSLLKHVPTIISLDITPQQYDALGVHYGHRPDRPGLLAWYKHRANCEVFRRAALIVPWTNWVKDCLVQEYGVPEDKAVVIPPGVDLALWRPGQDRPATLPLHVLFVGGDFTRKGGPELLRWFATSSKGRCIVHVVTKETLPPMEGLHVYNNLTANSPQLRRLYQQCDLFVLPSKGEAFGHVYVEALASGLPAIATTVGGTADIVEDGLNGLRIEPQEHALAQALEVFLSRPELCRTMGRRARIMAEERFDVTTNVNKLLQAFRSIVDRHRQQALNHYP